MADTPENPPEGSTTLVQAEAASVVAEPVQAAPEAPQEAEEPLPEVADDIVVVAKTSAEMEVAQKGLIAWVDRKIATIERDVVEAQTNLDTAVKRKWSTTAFKKALTIAKGRVVYYQKMKVALEAGYVIMPDMPGVTIAVRTSQTRPRQTVRESRYYGQMLPGATSDGSPAGKGQYIAPNIKYHQWQTATKDAQGRDQITHHARANRFNREFEFPVKFVKPQIFDETSKAMLHKVFDEIGIIGIGSPKPGQKLPATTTINRDPIVLGRIVRYEGPKRFTCAFLITWWLDTKAL